MGFHADRQQWERDYWRALLLACRGNLSQACRRAEVNRQDVYRLLRRLGLIRQPPITGRCGRKNRRELEIHYVD